MRKCLGAAYLGLLATVLAPAVARAQYVLGSPIDLTAMTPSLGGVGRNDQQAVVAPRGAEVLVAWLVERGGATTVVRSLACDGTITDPGTSFMNPTTGAVYSMLALSTGSGGAAPWALDARLQAGTWELDMRPLAAPPLSYGISSAMPDTMPSAVLNDLEAPSTILTDPTGGATLWYAISSLATSTSLSNVDVGGVIFGGSGIMAIPSGSPHRFAGYLRGRAAALPDGTAPAVALLDAAGNVSVLLPPFAALHTVALPTATIDAGPAIAALGGVPLRYLVVTAGARTGAAPSTLCAAVDASTPATVSDASCPHPGFTVSDVAAGAPGVTSDAWIGAVEHGGSHVFLGAYGSGWNQTVTTPLGFCIHPHVVSSTSCAVLVASCGPDLSRHTLAWIATPVAGSDGGVVTDASLFRDANSAHDASPPDDARGGNDASLPGDDARGGNDASPPDDAMDVVVVVGQDAANSGLQFHGGACQCAVGPGAGGGRGWGLGALGAIALGARRRRRRGGYGPV